MLVFVGESKKEGVHSLTDFYCDDLNKKDTVVSVDFIVACETLRKELSKSFKIAKKFKKELKLANLETEELIVRLDESNKKFHFAASHTTSSSEHEAYVQVMPCTSHNDDPK